MMEWTKIPTDLIQSCVSDKDILAIVKYQLIWAMLERQPTKEICMRYMTTTQYCRAIGYASSIQCRANADIKSVENHRNRQKLFYQKNQQLKEKPDGHTDGMSDGHTDDPDKIRLDKNIYPPLYISPPKGKKENPDSEKYPPYFQKWLAYKKERKQKYTPIGEKQCLEKLKKLSNWNEDIAIRIVDQSIERGWSGLFELKEPINTPDDKDEERKWKEWCQKNKSKETMNEHTN